MEPQGALGVSARPDELLHLVNDGLERVRWHRISIADPSGPANGNQWPGQQANGCRGWLPLLTLSLRNDPKCMKANTCPHCGHNPAVPLWRKSCLGPAVTTKCRACGAKVSVSWLSMLIVFPLVFAVVFAPYPPGLWPRAGLWVAALVLMTYLHWICVRIVPR